MRKSYKIFAEADELTEYLKKNKGRDVTSPAPQFETEQYRPHLGGQLRILSPDEAAVYLQEREAQADKWKGGR